jgi:signal transduction histidine kinase
MAIVLDNSSHLLREQSTAVPVSQPQRLAALAALLAHEARSPLATVSGYASLLQEGGSYFRPEQRDAMLGEIVAECNRLGSLISELAALYAQPLPRQARLRATDIVRVLRPLARSQGLRVQPVDRFGRLPPVMAAPVLLRRALQRLCSLHSCRSCPPCLRLEGRSEAVLLELTVATPAQAGPDHQPSPEEAVHVVFARWVAFLHGTRLYQDERVEPDGARQRFFRMSLRAATMSR